MASRNLEVINGYNQWIAIVETQLVLAGQESTEERFDQMNRLEQEKEAIKRILKGYSDRLDQPQPEWAEQIMQSITKLQGLNEKLQQLLEGWHGNASSNMKQVSTQRKILNSYGGVQNSDIVSYYIDSKK